MLTVGIPWHNKWYLCDVFGGPKALKHDNFWSNFNVDKIISTLSAIAIKHYIVVYVIEMLKVTVKG